MGMKINSGHFNFTNGSGGPVQRKREFKFVLRLQNFAEMPKNNSQISHIMRNDLGHLPNTPQNQRILIEMTSDVRNFLGIDKVGNEIYTKTEANKQYWAYVRKGIIQNGGVNIGEFRDFSLQLRKKGK